MIQPYIAKQLLAQFPFSPTPDQTLAIDRLATFLSSEEERAAFVLRGYAGTGKTTLVGALVRMMQGLHKQTVLLAPTGRAAKVFSHYAGVPAHTIHKTIYRQRTFVGEETRFELAPNKLRNALFIVDEASMLSNGHGNESLFGTGRLLEDLLNYVYARQANNRVLMVGDTAQLPPVGEEESPALVNEALSGGLLSVTDCNLTDVVRQAADSGVLANATHLREMLRHEQWDKPRITTLGYPDVHLLSGGELVEMLESSYAKVGVEETIVVTRSNKRANIYNNGIRNRIFGRESEITKGDLVMIAKNNYFWTEEIRKQLSREEEMPIPFIANGDLAEVSAIHRYHHLYGFHFADVTLRFPDYDNYEADVCVMLDTLQAEAASLPRERSEQLFQEVLQDYADVAFKRDRMKRVRENRFYNALQIKYAYAVTCHKAQGGQWERVFVDQGYLPDEMLGPSYLRWLYTAFTRTTDTLYLVNWPESQRA